MSKLVLVTGASGFLASHVIQQLLIQGYRVRGTARGPKVNELRAIYASEPTVDIVEIEDIAHGQFPQVFDGVYAVIHTASPLSGKETAEKLLNSAVEGSLNVLRQAEKAGITKFVVTSSIAAVLGDPKAQGSTIKPDHWSPITWEQGLAGGGDMTTYRASKKFAELAVWEWADAHPHVDGTTILPPFLYGPIASPSYLASHPSPHSISTNVHVYHLLSAHGTDNHNNETPTTLPPPVGGYVDVRDAARAHVGALERLITESSSSPSQLGVAQSTSDGTSYRKRVVLASPHGLSWIRAVEILRASRPDLSARLNKALLQVDSKDLEEMKALKSYDVDFEWSERLTGLKKSDYRSFEETILDGVDSLVKAEAIWTRA